MKQHSEQKSSRLIHTVLNCPVCDFELGLNQKTIRNNKTWYHEVCFKKISLAEKQKTQHLSSIKQNNDMPVEKKFAKAQMQFKYC